MNVDREMSEALAAHVEGLDEHQGGAATSARVRQAPGALAEVAGRLRQALVPVEPPADFARNLGRGLVQAARRRQKAARRLRRGLLIGAAALGSAASVAGVVTILVRRRRSQAQPRPAPG